MIERSCNSVIHLFSFFLLAFASDARVLRWVKKKKNPFHTIPPKHN